MGSDRTKVDFEISRGNFVDHFHPTDKKSLFTRLWKLICYIVSNGLPKVEKTNDRFYLTYTIEEKGENRFSRHTHAISFWRPLWKEFYNDEDEAKEED